MTNSVKPEKIAVINDTGVFEIKCPGCKKDRVEPLKGLKWGCWGCGQVFTVDYEEKK